MLGCEKRPAVAVDHIPEAADKGIELRASRRLVDDLMKLAVELHEFIGIVALLFEDGPVGPMLSSSFFRIIVIYMFCCKICRVAFEQGPDPERLFDLPAVKAFDDKSPYAGSFSRGLPVRAS